MTNTRLLAIAIGLAAGVELPAQRSVGATPPIPNLAGKIQTVLGPVDPSTIGPTLMHEHIFIEFQNPRSRSNSSAAAATSEEPLPFEQPITMGDLYAVRYG